MDEKDSVVIVGGKGKPVRTFPANTETKVLAYMKVKNRHPVTLAELSLALGKSKNYIGTLLFDLVKEGRIQRPMRAVYIFVK
jgi:hypothetical protein